VLIEWILPRKILYGAGSVRAVGEIVEQWGRQKAFVVTGKTPERFSEIFSSLRDAEIPFEIFQVVREPTVEDAENALECARKWHAGIVVAIGGGSVLDVGKVVAGLLTNPGPLRDYLEVVGNAKPLTHPAVPFLAIPTTAGTGSEATRNAVLDVPDQRVKVSIRSPLLVPWAAILDPCLTFSLPSPQTVASGLDALTQLIEAFVCKRANSLTDAVCREGLALAFPSLPRAATNGRDEEARGAMMLAAFYSGVALANAGLGAVHGLAGPLGGFLHAPHGAICAALLVPVVRTNIRLLREREPQNPALARYAELARIAMRCDTADAGDLPQWLNAYVTSLGVSSLADFGLREVDIPVIAEKGQNSSSTKANPVALTKEDICEILREALHGQR